MIHILKPFYDYVEKYITIYLPPEAVAYLLPVRFRIAVQLSLRGDKAKALRYINGVCRRRKDLAEVFERDMNFRQSDSSNAPLTAEMPEDILRELLAQDPVRLEESAKNFSQLSRFRVAAVFRALLLLRAALDNITSGQDDGKQHDAILLEIAANDFCQAILEKPAVIRGSVRKTLLGQLRHASDWSLNRKISVFMDDKAQSSQQQEQPLREKSVRIQGPSNRPSDLSELETDTTAVIGYAGPDSLVCPVARIDVSIYLTHKVLKLYESGRLHVLNDVGLAVVSIRSEGYRAMFDAVISDYNAIYSNIRTESCNSHTNGGVELFLWVIGAGASCVAITNFDMFTNPSYPSGYISFQSEEKLERSETTWRINKEAAVMDFFTHDPSQQYSIYKCFHPHDEISYDSVLDSIVSAPLSAYIEELEALYGEYG